jgi:hypothetical protein
MGGDGKDKRGDKEEMKSEERRVGTEKERGTEG